LCHFRNHSGAAGFLVPDHDYLIKLKKRCEEVGALLILDEIQPGFGRTGKLFSFEHFGIVPDILVMGKGMGGGVPVGAFMSSRKLWKHCLILLNWDILLPLVETH
jgi:acetylornithine/succinyldiaminopimelate/putrescine aminotransferase